MNQMVKGVLENERETIAFHAYDYKDAIAFARRLPYDGEISIEDKAGRVSLFRKAGERLVQLPYSA